MVLSSKMRRYNATYESMRGYETLRLAMETADKDEYEGD